MTPASEMPGRTGAAGNVITAATGAPVPGAAVEILAVSPQRPSLALAAITDAGGGYVWDLEPGTWDVAVSAAGHAPATRRIAVAAGVVVRADFALQPSA